MENKGKVFLVGAGPGDPGLLTLKAKQVLESADVIVYDYLANPQILGHAKLGAKKIYVGKQAGKHSWKQAEITKLLLKLASQGKRVARLKGGDPFVFGRGGEEALELAKAKITFEVVPGITSGIAALAYAGIPFTHRDLASCALFATGHERPGKDEPSLNYQALGSLHGTLVFFMGVENAPFIRAHLLQGGLDPKTPAAVIQWGTHARQRSLVSSLGDLIKDLKQSGLGAPALLVVGRVVSLKKYLDWFETKPLFGRSIVITRAREQASSLAEQLGELGAEVISAAAIRTVPIDPNPTLNKSFQALSRSHWLVFTSSNGVRFYFEGLNKAGLDARSLQGLRVAAIGVATARALAEHGIQPDLVPAEGVAESLLQAILKHAGVKGASKAGNLSGQRIVLARAKEGRDLLPVQLKALGAEVQDLALYETLPEKQDQQHLIGRFERGDIDLVTFTSSSTVDFFIQSFSARQFEKIKKNLRAASIGPITSQRLKQAGIKPVLQAKAQSVEGLVDAVQNYFKNKAVKKVSSLPH